MGSQCSAIRRSPRQIFPPYSTSSTAFASPPTPSPPSISIPIDRRSEGLQVEKNCRRTWKKRTKQSRSQLVRIDVLPDDVLLEIFDFYLILNLSHRGRGKTGTEAWQCLVHVCRRWRILVLGSPRRLNLQLYCTTKTPAKDRLDIWPALPLIVTFSFPLMGTDNIFAALKQSNRVCEVILLGYSGWELDQVLALMHVPFPELTDLRLFSDGAPVIPDSFLGGSAPRLQHFELDGVPFPGLPNLLLSANHLVTLWLSNIPHSGFISPEAIVAPLSVSSSLKSLTLEFQYPQSRLDWESRSLPPPKRSILPALDKFRFIGVIEYLEELVTHIDTPQLNALIVYFLNEIGFGCPRLAQFINCAPKLSKCDEAHVKVFDMFAHVELLAGSGTFDISIPCGEPGRRLLSIEQVCNSSLHPLSTVEHLYIEHLIWENGAIENLNTLWLELLLPFTAVKNLYLSKEFAPDIAAALQGLVGGRITQVLPSLQNIFVGGLEPSGPFLEIIGQFVSARQLSHHPIAIFVWK